MVGSDTALGFGVEGYPCPIREMAGLALTLRKLPHPATRQWFPASYPARGREPPMLAECLIFTSTERASPGSTNGGLRQKGECRLMAHLRRLTWGSDCPLKDGEPIFRSRVQAPWMPRPRPRPNALVTTV